MSNRIRMQGLFLAILVLTLGAGWAVAGPRLGAVDSIGITVSDMDRSERFYSEVLGFERVGETEIAGEEYEHLLGVFGLRLKILRMRLGDESIELMQFLAPRGRPMPADTHSNDEWFQHIAIVVGDMDAAYARLRAAGVEHASTGPQRLPDWNPNAGGISAFYFRDPDDNFLEIIHFPPDKGDPRWQRPSQRLFLGIDHSAIVVDDTDASLAFYRDALGMHIAGTSENFGPEQERLNNVFGARLRITALRADAGPGVELLEYLAPGTGRTMPTDTQANDLWHWQINASITAPGDVVPQLRQRHYRIVTTPGTADDEPRQGGGQAFLVRDPDGHAMMLFRPSGGARLAAPWLDASPQRVADLSKGERP